MTMVILFAAVFAVILLALISVSTAYEFSAYEKSLTSHRLPHASRLAFPTCPPPSQRPTFDLVKDFGAVGDNMTLNTNMFTAAITKIAAAGGGELLVPEGIFLTKPFILTSCMSLNLYSPKSFIQAITNISLWPVVNSITSNGQQYADFISGTGVTDVTITGLGIIDGGGYMWWPPARANLLKYPRGNLIVFTSSQYLTFTNINVHNSPAFNFRPGHSQHIFVQNLNIWNPHDSHNTDGFDPASCSNVTIRDSYFYTGDDAIAIKAEDIPSTDIHVYNLTIGAGHCGMCIGSHARGGAANISISNSRFFSIQNGFCFKGSRGTGGDVYNYTAKNIYIDYANYSAIALNDYYPGSINGSSIGPKVDQVLIENLTAVNVGRAGGIIVGLDVALMTNIHLRHVHILNYGDEAWNCSYSSGTYDDVTPSISHCPGFKPATISYTKQMRPHVRLSDD